MGWSFAPQTTMIEQFTQEIDKVVSLLRQSSQVFVVTGAGISADSGLPTYRGFGGLYNGRETEDGMPIEQALSGPIFRTHPEITWKYLAQIEKGARGAKHNRAHEVLAAMESQFDRVWILTQNIDGFHTTAGSQNVIEIHGNMHRMKCTSCSYSRIYEDYSDFEIPPQCPDCNALVRPDVVLFEEQLPVAAIEQLIAQSAVPFDLVMSIGTSSYFPYLVEPVIQAGRQGIPTVEINPGETVLSELVDVRLPLRAAESLEEIWKRFNHS